MKRVQQIRAVMLEEKTAWWASHRKNVLFRCGPGVGIASDVKSAFDQLGLRYRSISAYNGEVDPVLDDDNVEALFFVSLDRASKRVRHFVLNMLSEQRPSRKLVWATVTVSEDDFDLDMADPTTDDGFDIVVDVPKQPTRPQ